MRRACPWFFADSQQVFVVTAPIDLIDRVLGSVLLAWTCFKACLSALHPIRFNLLLAAAAIAALLTGQGVDMLRQLVDTGGRAPRWGFLLAALAFGLWLWWHARVIFLIDLGPGARSRPASQTWIKVWAPRLIGTVVALFPGAMILAVSQNRSTGYALLVLATVILIGTTLRRWLVGVFATWFSAVRQRWLGGTPNAVKKNKETQALTAIRDAAYRTPEQELREAEHRTETPSTREVLSEIWRDRRCFAATWLLLIAVSPIMVGLVLWRDGDLCWSAGTATMVGLMLLSAAGGALALVSDSTRLPLVGLAVVWMMASGWLTHPDTYKSADDGEQPQNLEAKSATRSLAESLPQSPSVQVSEALPAPDFPPPVVLVSASGGGIRSALWTATVLSELGALSPAFDSRVFAASGVSGGSVGLAAWRASLATSANEVASAPCPYRQSADPAGPRNCLQHALGGDLLTPALTTLLFTDLFARAVPLVPHSQRGRALELAFDRALVTEAGFSAIRNPIGQSVASNGRPLPFLVLNATELTTGQRVLFHDLPIAASQFGKAFTNAIDGRCLAPSTTWIEAAHHSARFPYVSPTGLITVDADRSTEHCANVAPGQAFRIGDGGYFDNSGVTTTLELLAELRRAQGSSDEMSEAGTRATRVRPIHVTIANDPDADEPMPPADQCEAVQPGVAKDPNANATTHPDLSWRVAAGLTDPLLGVLSSRTQRGLMGRGLLERLAIWPLPADRANTDSINSPLAYATGSPASTGEVISLEFRLYRMPMFDGQCTDSADMPLGWLLSRPAACEIQRQFCDDRNRQATVALFQALGDSTAAQQLDDRCRDVLAKSTRSACLRGEVPAAAPSTIKPLATTQH